MLEESVPVRSIVFAPKCVQSKAVWLNDSVTSQLSEELSSTSDGASVYVPSAARDMVISLPATVGSVSSTTVTVAVPVPTFPDSSVTESVTVFSPK